MSVPTLTTTQKIATLLLSLGAERSAEILEYLDPEQTVAIAREIAAMGQVPNQTRRTVLREFRSRMNDEVQQHAGLQFVEQVLDKAFDPQQAHEVKAMIRSAVPPSLNPPYLSTVTPGRAAELISGEPLHIMSLLLVTLPAECSAAILQNLPPKEQVQLALQLSNTTPPSAEVRTQLEPCAACKSRQIPAGRAFEWPDSAGGNHPGRRFSA